ncbi:phosphoglycerate mutase-like protein [Coniochaeta sp. PMI_546]|nr:phosphoglycerate mutase-like protein [Coniochaeta sp. PMI_546]
MPTYIHLVRHAQGFHNLSKENQQIRDPDLTPLGERQCATLRDNFPYHDKVTHLVASPMRRTLRTCLLGFSPEVKAGKKVIALPEVQELSTLPCDIGSDPAVLAKDFDSSKVDLSLVKEGWNDKSHGSPWEPTIKSLEARAKKSRVWLRDLAARSKDGEEVHIVVVSHGGFIHFFTEDWDGMNPSAGTGWDNTEYRTYEFVDPSGQDPTASLKETHPSWRRRRGSAIPLTETEQRELRAVEQRYLEKELDEVVASQKKEAASQE